MTSFDRDLLEQIFAQSERFRQLLRVVVRLSDSLNQKDIVQVFESEFGTESNVEPDLVVIGDLALKFSDSGKLLDVFEVKENGTIPQEVKIVEERGQE